jgi:regulator of sigma E protease
VDLIYTIVVTLFTLAVLVTVHEYGHFWVARRCGVKVLRFSIGFGTPLIRWRDKLDTEYVIAAIPLGGYVKMLDEREGDVTPGMEEQAFNRKPVLSRIAVVSAGPLANLLLAVLAYWFVFISGETGIAPVIGGVEQGSVAELAGLEAGQEIVSIDGHGTPTWQAVNFRLLERIGDTGTLEFGVRYPDSDMVYNSRTELFQWLSDVEEPNLVRGLGLEIYRPPVPVVLNEVVAGSPAEAAGLRSGDLIVAADAQEVSSWLDWVDYVRARPDEAISIRYQRGIRRDYDHSCTDPGRAGRGLRAGGSQCAAPGMARGDGQGVSLRTG